MMVNDDDDPFNGCWATYSENYHASDAVVEDAHGSTLGPKLARLTTARAGGGKAKFKGGGADEEEEDDGGPEPFMPCNYRQWEELLLIWAIPMTWFYLIFFAG